MIILIHAYFHGQSLQVLDEWYFSKHNEKSLFTEPQILVKTSWLKNARVYLSPDAETHTSSYRN